ncbi:unnamed protein product [Adineta steineri]|uniref:Uncharacterized protein n=1 Tax=Adineta steineri TaxID=433720 RepID=A0A815L4L4_9BILA|nr:unnamed protein product [Adineta steineri]CAF1485557.1 unnamed protein product [Adineta steineri]CAF4052512.1 unnamed protein product [Adineta steineri]CAF4059599.1 unnamed protein product [Adineta steineri]
MWATCRSLYRENQAQLDHIDKLEETYAACEAITYYTGNSCLSRTVNQACHSENMRQIFEFRVYIGDLHKQLVEHHEKNSKNGLVSCIQKLYRGKPLSGSVLQQLIDNKGNLISINGFLSTTIDNQVASFYHGDDHVNRVKNGYKPVLFILEIDTEIKQPYAYIATCSTKPNELEVLFSLGTIWRIKSIKVNEDRCVIELTYCNECDSQSTELLNTYTKNGCNLSSVGDILLKLGDDDEAEWFYKKMLKQSTLDNETRANLCYKIGNIRFGKKDYSIALENYKDAEKLLSLSINESYIPPSQLMYVSDTQSPLIAIYNNMGFIHADDYDFSKAVSCYQQALKVKNGPRSQIATVHNNLGLLYYTRSKYEEAREHHMKAVQLIDDSHSKWTEFKRNLDVANGRCQHLANTRLIN